MSMNPELSSSDFDTNVLLSCWADWILLPNCAFVTVSCRDLPQYGQKQWQSYFGRTFDVYTKLWKFQQQHR